MGQIADIITSSANTTIMVMFAGEYKRIQFNEIHMHRSINNFNFPFKLITREAAQDTLHFHRAGDSRDLGNTAHIFPATY